MQLDEEQIGAVVEWMNEWDQLKDSSIPIRFKEDFMGVTFSPKRLGGLVNSCMEKMAEYRIVENGLHFVVQRRKIYAKLERRWRYLWYKYYAVLVDEWVDVEPSAMMYDLELIHSECFATRSGAENFIVFLKEIDRRIGTFFS